MFFDASRNGRERSYIMHFARACVCAYACMCKTRTAGTFLPENPAIFYVFLSGDVCFRPGKPTFHGRETYVSPDGNIEILNATEDYLTDKSFISLFIIKRLQHLYFTNDMEAPTN